MGKLSETFQKKLSARMDRWGSRSDFVQKTRIARTTLDRWLSSERLPDLDQVEAVANGLGIDPIELLFSGELPKPPRPAPEQVIREFIEIFSEVTSTQQGSTMLVECIVAVLKNSRIEIRPQRPKEKE